MKLPVHYHLTDYQSQLLHEGLRDQIIEWLIWNDPNGCYSDEDAVAEDYGPLTLDAARVLLLQKIGQSRDSNEGEAVERLFNRRPDQTRNSPVPAPGREPGAGTIFLTIGQGVFHARFSRKTLVLISTNATRKL